MDKYLYNAPCIYFSCSDDGRIIEVNEAACRELGYTREELTGNKADIVFTVASRIFQQTHFFPLLKMHGQAQEIYITLLTKSNEQLPVLINAKREVIDGQAEIIYAGIVVPNRRKYEDELIAAKKAAEAALHENKELINARLQLQDHVEQLEKQMQLANKQNEELLQFNRVVTHDLQEPLRKLFLFVNMMLDDEEGKSAKEAPAKIKRVSEQMLGVVSGLQQYVWLTESSCKFEKIDLNGLVRSAQKQLEKEFPEVAMVLETDELPPIDVDSEQMQLLFYHLLSNAIRFRKSGSNPQVHISATSLLLNKFKNMRDKYKYDEALKLSVTDKGVGFDSEQKEQVFGLFKRLHSESGRGVGLALCKKIVENHGGSISISSRKGEGTTITVILPVNQLETGPGIEMIAKD